MTTLLYHVTSLTSILPIGCRVTCMKQQQQQQNRRTKGSSRKSSVDWGCDSFSLEIATPLQEWLTTSGLPPQKLALVRVDHGGRGLVSLRNIRQGEKLLYVPSSLVITSDSQWSNTRAGEVLKTEGVPDWPFLASLLLNEASQGTRSPWHAYISALPRQPESILAWSTFEVDKYLEASPVRDLAIERIMDVTSIYRDLSVRIFQKHPELFPDKFFTLEAFKWAFGILFSRLVRLPSLDQRVALVPWADMLNHSSQVETFLDYDSSSNSIIASTDRAYQPQEQVFISYGKRSNGELLLAYGFVPPDNNVDNSVDLVLALDSLDKDYQMKLDALKEHGLSSPCRFPVKMNELPLQLFAFAHLAVCPPSVATQFCEMAAAAAPGIVNQESTVSMPILPTDIEIKANEVILAACEAALSKYSKFLEASKELIDGEFEEDDVSKGSSRQALLKKKAITLCLGEQRILFRTQTLLRSKLRELRAIKASGEDSAIGFTSSWQASLIDGLQKIFR